VSQRLATPQPPRGSGAPQLWQPGTPALAAGRTDPGWPREEWLRDRVPPDWRDRLEQPAVHNTL